MFSQMKRYVPDVEDKIISYLEHRDLIASKLVNREWDQAVTRREGNKALFPMLGSNKPRIEEKILSFLGPKEYSVLKIANMNWFVATRALIGYDPLYKAVAKGHEHICIRLYSQRSRPEC